MESFSKQFPNKPEVNVDVFWLFYTVSTVIVYFHKAFKFA